MPGGQRLLKDDQKSVRGVEDGHTVKQKPGESPRTNKLINAQQEKKKKIQGPVLGDYALPCRDVGWVITLCLGERSSSGYKTSLVETSARACPSCHLPLLVLSKDNPAFDSQAVEHQGATALN